MDWANVTPGELMDALREVDWNMRPRPLTEFFARFTPPKSQGKLTSRLKCNIYYYRANYFALLVLSFVVAFFRNPFALFACAMSCLSLLCANDSFAQSMSEKITRSVRKYHPPTAAWMRRNANVAAAPSRPYSKSKVVHICGFQRLHVVAFLCVLSFFMLRSSRAVSTVLWALGMFAVGTLAHASLRSPNLKARLSSYREEFRAVWRGYSEA
mmetsp:Transcript_4643/g.19059  ORF Transcript_4643/g.19059 Transcript_4643/m.19059 type:complete len:212 (-) Transcript_4643:38-673(-)